MRLLLVHPGASFSTHDVFVGYRDALRRAGVEVVEYALDGRIEVAALFLRTAWKRARRYDPATEKPTAADAIYLAGQGILERALSHQVDWVIVVSAMYLAPDFLVLARRAGLKVAVLLTESPYDDAPQARIAALVDLAWTNEETSVRRLRQANPNVHYLRHAFDPARHDAGLPVGDDVPAHDVVFVGTGFQERIETLAAIDWSGIDLGLYGTWDLLGSRHRLRRFIRGGVIGNDEANALYRRAKVGLNLYRRSMGFGRDVPRVDVAWSLNPRALELAASGCFQVQDDRPEVHQVFGGLAPVWSDVRDLEWQLRHYLDHPQERQRIAAAMRAAVAGETFDARAARMLADLPRVSSVATVL